MHRILPLLFLFAAFTFVDVLAQTQRQYTSQRGTTYESLLARANQPAAYIDHVVLPGNESTATLAVYFRLDYNFLTFLRKRPDMTPPAPGAEYFAPTRMEFEIFEGRAPERRRTSQDDIAVFRNSWQDTIWTATFEETQSKTSYVQGILTTDMQPGDYYYDLQPARSGVAQREQMVTRSGLQAQARTPGRRGVSISPNQSQVQATFTLLDNLNISDRELTASLLNFGSNVHYGEDFHLLIHLPSNDQIEPETLTVAIYKLLPGNNTETEDEPYYETTIPEGQMFTSNRASISQNEDDIKINFQLGEGDTRYAYLTIPNSEFENSRYKLVLKAEGTGQPLAERIINSQWVDMPVSLYNLDIAIGMLKFIVDQAELRRINSGSASEKEKKFREFWAERNPTPDTEFNELMTEYYRRIDYAYDNFTTLETRGYETDQGRAHILYGAPVNIERLFPTNEPTREIWEYPDRTLIFEATTRFGDFRLISES